MPLEMQTQCSLVLVVLQDYLSCTRTFLKGKKNC